MFFFLVCLTGLFELKCEPAEGVVTQTTHINCNIKLLTVTQSLIIHAVVLTRIGNKTSSFSFLPSEKKVMGDTRFEAGNLPSLQLHNTTMSDAGQYKYYIRSSVGSGKTTFTIKVTGKRKMSSCSRRVTTTETKLHHYFGDFPRWFVFCNT